MKVRQLIYMLEKEDPDLEVYCYTEDEDLVPPKHLFRLLQIIGVADMQAEKKRGSDGIASLKLGQSDLSSKHIMINVSGDF